MKQNKLRDAIAVVRCSKRRARELLDAGNNRLWLILSAVLWLATAGAIYLLGAGIAYAADASIFTEQPSELATTLALVSYGVMLLLAIFILVPMTGGVMLLASYIYERRMLEAADLLAAFATPRQYLRCMGLGAYGLLYPVLLVTSALLGCVAAPSAIAQIMREMSATSVLTWLACAGIFLAGAVLVLVVAITFRSTFVKSAFLARGMSWREACLRTRELRIRNGWFAFYYRMSFVGHVALGVLTIGVSAMIDGIGHALLSHQFACDAFETQGK